MYISCHEMCISCQEIYISWQEMEKTVNKLCLKCFILTLKRCTFAQDLFSLLRA